MDSEAWDLITSITEDRLGQLSNCLLDCKSWDEYNNNVGEILGTTFLKNMLEDIASQWNPNEEQ
jgi:hypothetical protein